MYVWVWRIYNFYIVKNSYELKTSLSQWRTLPSKNQIVNILGILSQPRKKKSRHHLCTYIIREKFFTNLCCWNSEFNKNQKKIYFFNNINLTMRRREFWGEDNNILLSWHLRLVFLIIKSVVNIHMSKEICLWASPKNPRPHGSDLQFVVCWCPPLSSVQLFHWNLT